MKRYAFTMAEVLTTLVVIGIVAMMVIPNLIDSSNAKANELAAKKAKLDVAQAAMKVQAQCPRGHGCTNTEMYTIFKENLPNKGDTKYKSYNDTSTDIIYVISDVDNDGVTDIHYKIDIPNATTTEHQTCNVDKYIAGTVCNIAEFKTFSSAKLGENNDKTASAHQ